MVAAAAAQAADPPGVFRAANRHLDELSGLAVSRADPTLLWGHNDSGNGSELYRLGPHGEDLGSVYVPQAQSGDWEDIAAFNAPEGPALLIADVGDNFAFRSFVTLYAVRDPGREGTSAKLLWRLDFRWPDGPRDCEAVGVDETRGEILLVSKRDEPPGLYRLPLPARTPVRETVLTAERIGSVAGLPSATASERVRMPVRALFLNSPTGLSIAPDGRSALLLTPSHVYRYRRGSGAGWAAAFAPGGEAFRLPDLLQIEAVAIAADGRSAWIGSEASPSQLAIVPLP